MTRRYAIPHQDGGERTKSPYSPSKMRRLEQRFAGKRFIHAADYAAGARFPARLWQEYGALEELGAKPIRWQEEVR